MGESALAKPRQWLIGLGQAHASYIAPPAWWWCSPTSIVVGELIAQAPGPDRPEDWHASWPPINWLALATKPFIAPAVHSTETLLRALGVEAGQGNMTGDSIHARLAEGHERAA